MWTLEFVPVVASQQTLFLRSCSLLSRGEVTHTWGDQEKLPVGRGEHLRRFLETSLCIASSALEIIAVRFPELCSMFHELSKNLGVCLCPILWTATWKQTPSWRLILLLYFSIFFCCFFQVSERSSFMFFSWTFVVCGKRTIPITTDPSGGGKKVHARF